MFRFVNIGRPQQIGKRNTGNAQASEIQQISEDQLPLEAQATIRETEIYK
jgi:hypothetical protein